MITTNTTTARSALGATLAATCLALVACGSGQGTVSDRASHHTGQHAAADDVAAQVEYRKASLTQDGSRPQHATADDVEAWIEQHKVLIGKH
jgi:hypothetical protein